MLHSSSHFNLSSTEGAWYFLFRLRLLIFTELLLLNTSWSWVVVLPILSTLAPLRKCGTSCFSSASTSILALIRECGTPLVDSSPSVPDDRGTALLLNSTLPIPCCTFTSTSLAILRECGIPLLSYSPFIPDDCGIAPLPTPIALLPSTFAPLRERGTPPQKKLLYPQPIQKMKII